MYRVVFYSPDTHIEYDGWTPYKHGVGGGVTSRVRMSRALAHLGHDVVMVVNCPKQDRIQGVAYSPLEEVGSIDADVVIVNSSGGEFDLAPEVGLKISAQLKILWISGKAQPKNVMPHSYDFLYAKSNFLRDVVECDWRSPAEKIFVAYNGFDEDLFQIAEREGLARDPFRLIYASHPKKGLDSAISILRKLREVEPRFHLVVCGGPLLWGEREEFSISEPNVEYLGLIGQKVLAEELMKSSFSINLQSIEEGFGMLVTESMRAGCVVVASSVGAYPEL
ncbi:MAG: glycosyltransferase, partial [Anaerolineales bacterium]|nr:glycosyltransferase [Anaerolineales bacterium]